MPLSLFDHRTLSHYHERSGHSDRYGHSFGSDLASKGIRIVNSEKPFHLLYHLNLADPAIGLSIPHVHWLPLCYGFAYASKNADFIYRVLNDNEIKLIAPDSLDFDPDSPYPGYPTVFPESPLTFLKQPYDPGVAEDALGLAAVFGVEQLPEGEMQRAIELVRQQGLLEEWTKSGTFADWSPKDLLRSMYKEPFAQGAPLKNCENPSCTAEIAYRSDSISYSLPKEMFPDFDDADLEMHLEARDIRRDSRHVFALHQPAENDTQLWGDPYVQLIWDICEECHCISVTNQCT